MQDLKDFFRPKPAADHEEVADDMAKVTKKADSATKKERPVRMVKSAPAAPAEAPAAPAEPFSADPAPSSDEVFGNPEAAMVAGSAANMAVLAGDKVEEPEDTAPEDTPETKAFRVEIQRLRKTLETSFFELAFALHRVTSEKYYRAWGYKSFKDYLAIEFKDMGLRSAQFLSQIGKYAQETLRKQLVNAHGAYDAVIGAMRESGQTKCRLLARFPVLDEENWQEVVNHMQTQTADGFEDYLGDLWRQMNDDDKDKRGEDAVGTVVYKFRVGINSTSEVDAAVQTARKACGDGDRTVSDAEAFRAICIDYNLTTNGRTDVQEVLHARLSALETALGVKLVAVANDGRKLVFGKEAFEKIAAGDWRPLDKTKAEAFDSDLLDVEHSEVPFDGAEGAQAQA